MKFIKTGSPQVGKACFVCVMCRLRRGFLSYQGGLVACRSRGDLPAGIGTDGVDDHHGGFLFGDIQQGLDLAQFHPACLG